MLQGQLTEEDEEAVLQELNQLIDQTTKAETEQVLDQLPDVPTTIEGDHKNLITKSLLTK